MTVDNIVEADEALKEAAPVSKPKKMGRPKGSLNKPKQPKKPKPRKSAKHVGYKGTGRPPKAFSLIPQLRELLQRPAKDTVMTNEYCERNGLDAKKTTVAKVLLHCQLYWALEGSAAHMQQIIERIDGKPMMRVEAAMSGKMDVTTAMTQMLTCKD